MALKPDREVKMWDISYTVNTVCERGGVMVSTTDAPGSGAAMDSPDQVAEYAANASGRKPVGLLDTEFVDIDQNRQIKNPYKDEEVLGGKAALIRDGWVVTNMIVPGAATGTMPADAYVGTSGMLTTVSGAGLPRVGQFETRVDSQGYAKVYIKI